MSDNTPDKGKPITPSHVVLTRLLWVAFGPVVLLMSGATLLVNGGGWSSLSSIAFLAIIPVMVVGRFIEQNSGFGHDSTGAPSTWAGFRTYVLIMVPFLIGAWVVLNIIGGFLK